MFNEKTAAEILGQYPCDGRMTGFFLALRLGRKLRVLKKRIKNNRMDVQDENAVKLGEWLRDNFSATDEGVRDKIRILRKSRGLEKSRGQLRFFAFFSSYLKKTDRCNEKHIMVLFSFANKSESLELSDGNSLIILFECAVYDAIMDCFLKSFENIQNAAECLEKVENLFFTLEELCGVSSEDVLACNKTEMILSQDPYGIYTKLSAETKNSYRNNLIRLSRKRKEPCSVIAEEIVNKCGHNKGAQRHIGAYLCDRADGGKMYLVLAVFVTVLFLMLLLRVSPLLVLSLFSVYRCTRLLMDKFFNRFVVKPFHLPRIELDGIPDGNGVMAVITTLLTGGKGDGSVFERLENMYHSNGGRNVYFAVLADLADSSTQTAEKDAEIISMANKRISELRHKYGESFFLFVRQREYSQSEMCYIAPERKRGAVGALTNFLCSKSDAFSEGSIKPCEDICRNIRFVFTLDSDTNLAFDCLRHMTGIMLHPQNTPVVDEKKGIVTSGYGILQPSMNTCLSSAVRTCFSKIMCGHGGVDLYMSGGSDFYMSLFGRSIFCGKGMFDKNCFYKTLCGKNDFKAESILSHDAPEGARLRCAYVQDVTLTDSFPKEELAYYKRLHRWIRGDVQNLGFLQARVENSFGESIENNIDVFSKFMLSDNVLNAVFPVFSLISLFASLFCEKNTAAVLVTVTFAAYILPFVYSVFSTAKRTLWHNVRRLFYSRGIHTGLVTEFLRMLFRICALPKSAEISLDAITRSIYRMTFSGRKKLEWMTAAQNDAESRDGLLGYVRKNLFSAVCGCVFFTVSDIIFLRFVALLWLFLPLFAYLTGKENQKKTVLSLQHKKTMTRYASDMWRYFEENTNKKTNHLPPDNISLCPVRKISRMTSPTNIGLYLLSVVVARKFGFIDSAPMQTKIENCIDAIEKLPSYKGLLYNWYDVFTAKSMEPEYVSSVDVGNFIVCLECVCGALSELENELPNANKLILRIRKLIDKMDLSLLYDKKRQLFYIGAVNKNGELIYDKNRYDMLMSEARSLSFSAVSKRTVPVSHLSHLSRKFVEGDGYMGLASWSGTAFEFFMPELFVKSGEGSLCYEALHFAYDCQKKSGVKTKHGQVFGISESCYNELDGNMNYKYKAFGVSKTAVNVFDEQKVISPYSSFLFMPVSVTENLENLRRLEELGIYGEYGFFESVDFERKKDGREFSAVRCFMSHHIGMSLCALANAVFDNVVHDWFLKNEKNRSAIELCDERLPYNAYVRKSARYNYGKFFTPGYESEKQLLYARNTARLDNGNLRVYARRDRLIIKCFDYYVTDRKAFKNSLGGFGIAVKIGDESFGIGKDFELSCNGGKIVYSKRIKLRHGDAFDLTLSVTIGKNTSENVRMLVGIRPLSGQKNKPVCCTFSLVPLLEKAETDINCTFFEEASKITQVYDGKVLRFENSNTGIYMYARLSDCKNPECTVDNDTVIMKSEPCLCGGSYEVSFVMTLSQNRRCAEMGMVRFEEDSFDDMVRMLEKTAGGGSVKKNGRLGNSAEACSSKKKISSAITQNSSQAPFVLISGRCFSSLILEDNLGFSFGLDVNEKRVTAFDKPDRICSEALVFDGCFDLCKNANSMELCNGIAVYQGKHGDYVYKVETFIPENRPVKIIRVSTDSILPLSFLVKPHCSSGINTEIAGGIVLFGAKKTEEDVCFVSGYLENAGLGAKYSVGDRIKAEFKGHGEDGIYEYVFAVGQAHGRDSAYGYELLVRTEYEALKKSAVGLNKSVSFDIRLMPENIKKVLSEIFVFPKENTVYRGLVKTCDTLSCFDALLLCYANDTLLPERLSVLFGKAEKMSAVSRLMCPVILSEYVRISGDTAYPDEKKCGESIYRRVLVLLSSGLEEMRDNEKMRGLSRLSLLCMADLCDRLGDTRTAFVLRDKEKELGNDRKGFFM